MRTVRFLENLRTEQFGFGFFVFNSDSYRKNRACSTLVAAPPSLLHPAVAAHPGGGRRVPRRCSLGGVRRRRASSPTGRRGVRRHRASPPAVHPPLQGTRDGWSRRRLPRQGLEEPPPPDPDGIGGGGGAAAADLRKGRPRLAACCSGEASRRRKLARDEGRSRRGRVGGTEGGNGGRAWCRRTGREGGGRGRGRAPPRRDSEREGGRLGQGTTAAPPPGLPGSLSGAPWPPVMRRGRGRVVPL